MTALLHQHRNHQEELFHAPEANGLPNSGQGAIHEAPLVPSVPWRSLLEELLAVLQGGEAHRFLELHGEGALVVEAKLHCDAADGRVLFAEEFAGFMDAHLDDVLLRGEVEVASEFSLELSQ